MKVAAIGVSFIAVLAAVIAAVLFTRRDKLPDPEIALELPAQIARPDPLHYDPGRTVEYEQAAAFGLSHVLFEKSPGGVLRAAKRTARFRDIVDNKDRDGVLSDETVRQSCGLDGRRTPGALGQSASKFWRSGIQRSVSIG